MTTVIEPVAALVLAAGHSRRFGAADKLMASARGVPLLGRVLRALAVPGIEPVLCVVRPDAETALRHGLAGEPAAAGVTWVRAPTGREGLADSIGAGVAAAGSLPGRSGLLIVPGDMPGLTPAFVQRLLDAFAAGDADCIVHASTPGGEQRNPVIWPARLRGQLLCLAGDRGAKYLIERYKSGSDGVPVVSVAVAGDASLADIDTEAELSAFNAGQTDAAGA